MIKKKSKKSFTGSSTLRPACVWGPGTRISSPVLCCGHAVATQGVVWDRDGRRKLLWTP
jgi:hypothetical protein